jgi:hypothetical protein
MNAPFSRVHMYSYEVKIPRTVVISFDFMLCING